MSDLRECLGAFPAVVLTGPRQCGKTTLARQLAELPGKPSLYLDLENERDRAVLGDANAFLDSVADRLVILDEVQRMPELFPQLRGVIDRRREPGRFLLLGSASPLLMKHSSESLAGRVAHVELSPFCLGETGADSRSRLWLRGGFPDSFLASDESHSFRWRREFISTFLERDIPLLGLRVPAESLRRFWRMLAHAHGEVLNKSRLGESLGVSHVTVGHYLDILAQTYMVRSLPPCLPNLGKRLVKSPKVYLRDSGLLHTLLGLKTEIDLRGHPVFGASWEGFALEETLATFPEWEASHYRTARGVELDLVLEKGGRRLGFEFKASSAPSLTRGFHRAVEDLRPERVFVVAPVNRTYPAGEGICVCAPENLPEAMDA